MKVLGQYNTEAILREHIERLGGGVEFGTELRSFEQRQDRVDAVLVTRVEGEEVTESVTCRWLVGADGPEGTPKHIAPFRLRLIQTHVMFRYCPQAVGPHFPGVYPRRSADDDRLGGSLRAQFGGVSRVSIN